MNSLSIYPSPVSTRRIWYEIHCVCSKYCLSKKSWTILCSYLTYEMGQDFFNMQWVPTLFCCCWCLPDGTSSPWRVWACIYPRSRPRPRPCWTLPCPPPCSASLGGELCGCSRYPCNHFRYQDTLQLNWSAGAWSKSKIFLILVVTM